MKAAAAIPLLLLAGAAFAAEMPAYTNHAALVLKGWPVALAAKRITLSNDVETLTVPLSTFPEKEQRRIRAEYVLAHPSAGTDVLAVPREVRSAIDGLRRDLRLADLRLEKGICTKAERDALVVRATAALKAYCDRAEGEGRLLPAERRVLFFPGPSCQRLQSR